MSVAKGVQPLITGDDLAIDPRLFAFGAFADHISECRVDFNLKFALFPGPPRGMRQMKTAERPAHSKILILDFGSQYTQVIGRRIRELQVYSEILPFETSAVEIAKAKPNGIILSGGPASVYDKGAPEIDPEIFNLGIPILGICYGLMLMAHHLGGEVKFTGRREFGAGMLQISKGSQVFDRLGDQRDVW